MKKNSTDDGFCGDGPSVFYNESEWPMYSRKVVEDYMAKVVEFNSKGGGLHTENFCSDAR